MIAREPVNSILRDLAATWVAAVREKNLDVIWNDLISNESIEIISTLAIPSLLNKLSISHEWFGNTSSFEDDGPVAMAFAVQSEKDVRNWLLEQLYPDLPELYNAFGSMPDFVFFEPTAGSALYAAPGAEETADSKDCVIPFILALDGVFRVDLAGVYVFALGVSGRDLFELGLKAIDEGKDRDAHRFFTMCGKLNAIHSRLETIWWNHPVVGKSVSGLRKQELLEDRDYFAFAQSRIESFDLPPSIESSSFLRSTFRSYDSLEEIEITEADLRHLHAMSESELRIKVASIIENI